MLNHNCLICRRIIEIDTTKKKNFFFIRAVRFSFVFYIEIFIYLQSEHFHVSIYLFFCDFMYKVWQICDFIDVEWIYEVKEYLYLYYLFGFFNSLLNVWNLWNRGIYERCWDRNSLLITLYKFKSYSFFVFIVKLHLFRM